MTVIRPLLAFLLAVGCAPTVEAPVEPASAPTALVQPDVIAAPPGASLYALDVPLVIQDGTTTTGLDLRRGHPTLLSMFYTTCPMACPLLIQDIQALEDTLTPDERAALRVVLVSLDPANDAPAALRDVVSRHALDPRWTLGAPPADRVREVAAALGVRYRPLPEGGFAHTAVLTLLDAEGRVVARSEGEEGRDALVMTLRRLAASEAGAVTGGS